MGGLLLFISLGRPFGQYPAVFTGKDANETRQRIIPIGENLCRTRRASQLVMFGDDVLQPLGILVLVRHLLEINHGLVAAATETIVFIQNVCKAPGHARSEISSGTTQADQMTP